MKPTLNHTRRLMSNFLRGLNMFLDYYIISQGLVYYSTYIKDWVQIYGFDLRLS